MSEHIPVLLDEVVTSVAAKAGDVIVDGTFGRGGYSRAVLASADCRLIAVDRDPEALAVGQRLEAELAGRFTILAGTFGAMDDLLGAQAPVDGVMLDIGVSSPQIDEAERGFSFRLDGPLDMRMSRSGESAADIVNAAGEEELANIFYRYGEERHSRRVARAIVMARAEEPFTRTLQLAAVIRRAVPKSKDGIDPATRSFQGLRIAVNDELGELERGLVAAEKVLKPGGRLVVVTFHSLEDRIVKDFMRNRGGLAPAGSRYQPEVQRRAPSFRLDNKKAVEPGEAELARNPRARSSKLRVAIRTEAPAWGREAA
ncbi:16S rRNA (cytosine(1402)-N(4))-methyltransferase RsmH [Lacibacterium aquatile]|uniref:Ribosomal RNA small subunit methyltransferase H n=1 Tax=Lacibacterium aquatile TaxID=1168082 RepID=A0ABW5DRZ6_9PROT